jgi:serine/threonine protein kinase
MRSSVQELFHAVADLSPDDRAAYFAEHRVGETTRKEVEDLIEFDSVASQPLKRDISDIAAQAMTALDPRDSRCGPYLLKNLLGRGGMGAVYFAERVDGELSQGVAVKLLRPGADDPPLRRRFLAERQILSTLSHPNIARMFDAGHRDDGQPYLVMEYVKGKVIDVYCVELGPRNKIALFLKVCAAVSYLHRNLVVHRDLKPSNILVTEEGEPKLLDFGIAKMLDLATDSTVTGSRMLTPEYASPEQILGRPMTTATDVYSLGAVLYKLLTGSTPHQFGRGDSAGGMALAISSGDITPPSKLAPAVKDDLEFVLMKALRREPQERYATIDQFAEDLENYLESRPIRARKGDTWYRTEKFLRRHWMPMSAAALAILSLTAGLAVANRERVIAQRRFMDVRQLSNKLFDIDTEAGKLAGSTRTRQLIVDTSLEYLRRLSADAQQDPELAMDVGNAYMRVARVQGVAIAANLGQVDQAEQNLLLAERFIHSVLVAQPTNRLAMLRTAQIAHDRMLIARSRSRDDEALMFARKSAEWLEKFGARKGDESESLTVLRTYLNVADQHMYGRQFEDALRLSRRATEIAAVLNDRSYYRGTFHWVSAEVFRRRGELDQALSEIRESVRLLDPGSEDADQSRKINFVLALVKQGAILGEDNAVSLDRPEEAVVVLDQAFNLADGLAHKDPNDQAPRSRLAMAGVAMGDILRHSDARRAVAVYDHTLLHLAEIKDNASIRRYEVSALAGSSYALRSLGRNAEAKQRLDGAFERLRLVNSYPAEKIKPGSEPDVTLRALADLEAAQGDVAGAIDIYKTLLGQMAAWGAKADTNLIDAMAVSRAYASLAALHRRVRQVDLASDFETRRTALWRGWDTRVPNNPFIRRQINSFETVAGTP